MSIRVSVLGVLITSERAALDVGTTCQASVPVPHIFLSVCVCVCAHVDS